MRWTMRIVAGLLALWLLLHLIPVDRSNPPEGAPLDASPEVQAVLQQSCYDCHSNRSTWPWYSYLVPVSWIVADHVHEGREHVNFSNWGRLPAAEQAHLAEEMIEELDEGEMPMPSYLLLHGEAEVSADDREVLEQWARGLLEHPGEGPAQAASDLALDGTGHADHETGNASTSAAGSDMVLNDGRPWVMDQHTRQSLARMRAAFAASSAADRSQRQDLGRQLEQELQRLIAGCTMSGAAHDQLHVFLTGLIPAIRGLAASGDEDARRTVGRQLESSRHYFE